MPGMQFICDGLQAAAQAASLRVSEEASRLKDYADDCLDENLGELPPDDACWKDWGAVKPDCLNVLLQFRHDRCYREGDKHCVNTAIAILRHGLVVEG